jgi:hypothetical protein
MTAHDSLDTLLLTAISGALGSCDADYLVRCGEKDGYDAGEIHAALGGLVRSGCLQHARGYRLSPRRDEHTSGPVAALGLGIGQGR